MMRGDGARINGPTPVEAADALTGTDNDEAGDNPRVDAPTAGVGAAGLTETDTRVRAGDGDRVDAGGGGGARDAAGRSEDASGPTIELALWWRPSA